MPGALYKPLAYWDTVVDELWRLAILESWDLEPSLRLDALDWISGDEDWWGFDSNHGIFVSLASIWVCEFGVMESSRYHSHTPCPLLYGQWLAAVWRIQYRLTRSHLTSASVVREQQRIVWEEDRKEVYDHFVVVFGE